ncbi:MAG: hypothetical protein H6624_19665 [Bdellovibrionaceae bacterium]|nr:hypothetical protein [Bdellovibrionales bacterium]MCB9086568.1 hypothetical protein [Pseudobdellovibrionaceae bacterium]
MIRARFLSIFVITLGFLPQVVAAPCASACQFNGQAKRMMHFTPAQVKAQKANKSDVEEANLPPCHRQAGKTNQPQGEHAKSCGLGDCLVVDQTTPPQVMSFGSGWSQADDIVTPWLSSSPQLNFEFSQSVRLVLAQNAARPPNVPLYISHQVFRN